MRTISILIILCVFSACYDDFDISEERIIVSDPGTLVTTGLNGHIDFAGQASSGVLTLHAANNTVELDDELFFTEWSGLRKENQVFSLYEGERLIGICREVLYENDVVTIDLPVMPALNSEPVSTNEPVFLEIRENLSLSLDGPARLQDGSAYTGDYLVHYASLEKQDFERRFGYEVHDREGNSRIVNLFSSALWIEFATPEGQALYFEPGRAKLEFKDMAGDVELYGLQKDGRFLPYYSKTEAMLDLVEGGLILAAETLPARRIWIELKHNNTPVSYARLTINDKIFNGTAEGRYPVLLEQGSQADIYLVNACDVELMRWTLDEAAIPGGLVSLEVEEDAVAQLLAINTDIVTCPNGNMRFPGVSLTAGQDKRYLIFKSTEIDVFTDWCIDEFSMAGFDSEDWSSGPVVEWNSSKYNRIGALSNCDEFESGYAWITINSDQRLYDAFDFDSNGEESLLSDKNDMFRIRFDGESEGNYKTEDINIFIDDPGFGASGYRMSCETSVFGCGIDQMEVSQYPGAEEDWIRLNFSGTIWAQTIDPPVAGYYDIEGTIFTKTK